MDPAAQLSHAEAGSFNTAVTDCFLQRLLRRDLRDRPGCTETRRAIKLAGSRLRAGGQVPLGTGDEQGLHVPKGLQTGRSSLGASDQLSRALGWFSIGLGATELLAARRITRALGMQGNECLVRAYGAREIGSGLLSLSIDNQVGLWSRVAGDALDIAIIATATRGRHRGAHQATDDTA